MVADNVDSISAAKVGIESLSNGQPNASAQPKIMVPRQSCNHFTIWPPLPFGVFPVRPWPKKNTAKTVVLLQPEVVSIPFPLFVRYIVTAGCPLPSPIEQVAEEYNSIRI